MGFLKSLVDIVSVVEGDRCWREECQAKCGITMPQLFTLLKPVE